MEEISSLKQQEQQGISKLLCRCRNRVPFVLCLCFSFGFPILVLLFVCVMFLDTKRILGVKKRMELRI